VITAPALLETDRGAALHAALASAASGRGFDLAEATDQALASAASTDSTQGIIAIGEHPERSFENIADDGHILVLDGVQDPGNVGTILRTAQAFGVAATIALPGTADLWNPKVVRSAMGALFSHVAFSAGSTETMEYLRARSLPIWATSAAGEPITNVSGERSVVIVVGNEANGVSQVIAKAATRTVAIPIRGVESLNVAVATGIILFAMTTA
jgi:TrmH family RNA methyltransferase